MAKKAQPEKSNAIKAPKTKNSVTKPKKKRPWFHCMLCPTRPSTNRKDKHKPLLHEGSTDWKPCNWPDSCFICQAFP